MIQLFAIGLISILGQVVLLRELSVAFYGVELIYALALGIWLFWTAAGATISRRTLAPSAAGTNLLFLLFALLLPLDIAFIRAIRLLFAAVPGAYLPFGSQLVALSVSLFPIGLVLGWLFQWTAKQYISKKRSLATAYAIESAGGLCGGVLATFFLRFEIQNFAIALLCALAAATASLGPAGDKRPVFIKALSSVTVAVVLLALWQATPLDRRMSDWAHPHLVETSDSPYGRITLTASGGQVAVFENDALLFTTEGTEAEEFANIAAIQHPNPTRVLILGGGIEGTLPEVLKHSPRSVDYVELNPVLLRIARAHIPEGLRNSLQAEGVHLVVADPRQFLSRSGKYDLILAGLPEPDSGQNNRFYTIEFFAQCKARLGPGGVLAFRLKSSENLWTPQLARRMASIYRAAKSVFAEVVVLPGGVNTFIASAAPLPMNPSVLASRLQERGIQGRLVSASYIRYLYTNDRFAEIARTLAAGNPPVNTDTRPICYQYTLMIWLSKFFPALAFPDLASLLRPTGVWAAAWWSMALALPAIFFLFRGRPSIARMILVGAGGFIGMVLETVLILHYQVKRGILYQDIGILLTSFMAGLALGAIAMERWLALHATRDRFAWWYGAVLPVGFAVLAAVTGVCMIGLESAGLCTVAVLLAMAGFMVAGIFAFASVDRVCDQRSVVTPLYAADLAGGCLGSLAASLLLVPFAGLFMAALLMAPLSIACLILLIRPSK